MTKAEYLRFRNQYIPPITKVVFVLESPPTSGRYFYNRDGALSEPLFRAMMKDDERCSGDIACVKREGFTGVCQPRVLPNRCNVHAHQSINHSKGKERNAIILRDFPLLVGALREYTRPEMGIALVKANVCELLEARLIEAGFNVLNHGTVIPFPSTGQQSRFAERVQKVLRHAAADVPRAKTPSP